MREIGIDMAAGVSHILAVVLGHDFGELDGACNVVVIVAQRVLHRLVYVLATSEMNNCVESASRSQGNRVSKVGHASFLVGRPVVNSIALPILGNNNKVGLCMLTFRRRRWRLARQSCGDRP